MKKGMVMAIIVIVIVITVIGAVCYVKMHGITSGGDGEGHPEVTGELLAYEWSCGGNENGNSHEIDVKALDDGTVVLSYSDMEWYGQDPEIEEYAVDPQILKELETVFRTYKMHSWQGKTFTDEFICDGETESYYFRFSNGDSVWFSSQIFDRKTAEKLQEFDEIIKSYKASGTRLPGLLLPELTDEEMMQNMYPEDGTMRLIVNRYREGALRYSFLNGTDEDIECEDLYALYLIKADGSEEVVAEETEPGYTYTVYAHGTSDDTIDMDAWLTPGMYRLEADGYTAEFEIR